MPAIEQQKGIGLKYAALNNNPPEIRVLDLHPSLRSSAPLECSISHRRLSQAQYAALSYVWGQQDHDTADLQVEYDIPGRNSTTPRIQHLRIGSNLAQALKCLRRKTTHVVIWVDAVCINQNDTEEQSSQVEMMRSIYSKATEVHAWLGPSYGAWGQHQENPSSIEGAFKIAEAVWQLAQTLQYSNRPTTEEQWLQVCFTLSNVESNEPQSRSRQAERWYDFAKTLRDRAISTTTVQRKLAGMAELSRLEYFARMWVLQETGRARALTFHYNARQISHVPLMLALSLCASLQQGSGTHPELRAELHNFSPRFLRCLDARTTCGQESSVREVLELAYLSPPPMQHVTKLQDLIYARLGLASDQAADRKSVIVDVGKSAPEVFTAATAFLFEQGYMDPLIAFEPYITKAGLANNSMPSWAYDWSKNSLNVFAKYNACGGTRVKLDVVAYPGARLEQALSLTGIAVGTIEAQGRQFHKLVQAAGLSDGAVSTGALTLEPLAMSSPEKSGYVGKIKDLHQQLNSFVSDADVEQLFRPHTLPLPKFWCWWLMWMLDIKKIMPVHGVGSIIDLLFHTSTSDLGGTAGLVSIEALVDLRRWLSLLFATSGAGLAEVAFRSAWGMRAAMLKSGRLCYVPEMSRENDCVVVFHGVNAPLVLRKQSDGRAQRKIGPAYVRNAMSGELVKSPGPDQKYYVV